MYNTIFYHQTLYGPMSGFTGNYYGGVPNVNRSRIPVRTLGTIQEGGQPGGFNMYNTSTITQILTNTQTTTPIVPTGTQPTNTQTTPPTSTTTQTTTPQVPVSDVTTLPNILNTTTTPVGTTTGATQGGSSTGNSGNSTGGFNFFNNLYGNTGGLGFNPPRSQGFGFNNTQNLPPGFGGGFGGGNPGGNPGGPPGGGGNPENNNLGGLDPNVATLVNALTGMNIGGGYTSREGSFVKPGEFGGTETEDPNEWLERFNRVAEANMWTEYRRFQIIGGYLVGAAARWYDEVKGWIGSWGGFQQAFLQKFASPARKNTWYLKYKNCKQAGRIIDAYALEFQANWRKVDQRDMMPPDSVLADFISGLDPQISVMLYGLAPASLDEIIMKAKMIEMGQRNAAGTMQYNAKLAQLKQENALLHQQLEWQPKPPQPQLQPQLQQQQTQRFPQN